MEKARGRYFQVRSPYYQVAQCNQKTFIPFPQDDRSGRSEKAKQGHTSTQFTATTSVHLPKPVSTDLTIIPDSVLTNPLGLVKAPTP